MFGVRENPSGRFSMDEIRKATGDFNESNIIGEGSFGRVYKGVIYDGSMQTFVAVKRILTPESKEGIQGLETEIKMLSRCRHSNLVNLLGYCNENQEMILVYEYMSGGNFADHLYRNKDSSLTWEQRLKICIGVARGLDYLHSGTGLTERIVHLDIKSDNILLDDNLAAKIADLGLSRIGPANQPNTQVKTNTLRGTEVYMDPDYRKTGNYSRKSDVYSFGVVLLEVLSGTCAWRSPIIPEFDRANWIQQHISKKTLNQIVDPRIVSEIQPGSLNCFLHTASKTLHLDSERRPSMSSVVAQLESALERQDEDDPFEVGYEGETSWNSVPGNAPNVFGDPIGNKQMVKMGLDRTRANRALVAYRTVTPDQDKYKKALGSLQDVVLKLGNELTKTSCLIYNATGETINYVTSCDLYGQAEPYPYPMKIHNGQWGAFTTTIKSINDGQNRR